MKAGTYLRSSPGPEGDFFENAIVFITACDANGATGFVINKIFPRSFNELVEFSSAAAFPMYEGGPVEPGDLFLLHRRPDLIPGGVLITGNIYFGGDFNKAVQYINSGAGARKDLKLFVGYCGWDTGDLEQEIAEGSWIITDETSFPLFQ